MANPYTQATKGLQNVGGQIRANLKAGQASPRAKQANYAINPLKGTGKAFMSAFDTRKARAHATLKKKGLMTNYSK
jgi:hypothetical protein